LKDQDENPANVLKNNEIIKLHYSVKFFEKVNNPVFTCLVKTREGIAVSGTNSMFLKECVGRVEPGQTVEVDFSFSAAFVPGIYYVNCGIRDADGEGVDFIHRRVDAAIFRVSSSHKTTALVGFVDLQTTLNTGVRNE
jgi:lipopolysaccharide transport system ATP-binding protein